METGAASIEQTKQRPTISVTKNVFGHFLKLFINLLSLLFAQSNILPRSTVKPVHIIWNTSIIIHFIRLTFEKTTALGRQCFPIHLWMTLSLIFSRGIFYSSYNVGSKYAYFEHLIYYCFCFISKFKKKINIIFLLTDQDNS